MLALEKGRDCPPSPILQMGKESLEICGAMVGKLRKESGSCQEPGGVGKAILDRVHESLFPLLTEDRRQRELSLILALCHQLDPPERMGEGQGFHPQTADHWMELATSCYRLDRWSMGGEAKAITKT